MSEQEGTQTPTKPRRSRRASNINNTQKSSLLLPANDDKVAWNAYWKAQGRPWRTEPEIDAARQKFLAERRSVEPDYEQGIYPFKEIKLSRADVEWLLATHEDGLGPVDWNDERQREREGLDLRGADLRREDLRNLPLACMCGGFRGYEYNEFEEWIEEAEKFGESAAIHLEEANLQSADLIAANLSFAHLEDASFMDTHLERALLCGVHLERAVLQGVHLEAASLIDAHMESCFLNFAHLEGANLCSAHLENTLLQSAYLEKATLRYTHLEGAILYESQLKGADLECALRTHLEGANLSEAHLEKADIRYAHLEGGILCRAFFDSVTKLDNIVFSNKQYGSASLSDVHWGDVNVAVVDWSSLSKLGDEQTARQLYVNRRLKGSISHLNGFKMTTRAYRQLEVILRNHGLEDAARFTYRAQLMQRKVFWYQSKFLSFFGSLFLDLLSGYGYKPLRCFIAYLLVIFAFATAYFIISHKVGPVISPLGSVVFSMTSFHGRGFFPGGIGLDDPLTVVAALEAFIGLLIEVTFIATLTQRLFGK